MLAVEVCEGDISQIEADALVNAANNHLWMGSGVAGALKEAGGQEIEKEAMKKGPVSRGDVVVTGAGKLKARYVIHAAVMGQDLRTDAETIQKATENSLRIADTLGCRSLAFPAFGTGVGGFPVEECARIMIWTVREHATSATGIDKIIFVLYGEPSFRVFQKALHRE